MKKKVVKIFSLVTVFPIIIFCIFGIYATSVMAVYGEYYNKDWQQGMVYSDVTLAASSPKEGQIAVATDTSVTLKFSDNILYNSSQGVQICLYNSLNKTIDIDIKTNGSNKLIITPKNKLNKNTTYKLYVCNIKDNKGLTIKPFWLNFITESKENSRFTDVESSHWAYNAIIELSDRGIITGYSDKSFKPNESVTRSQFASMLTKALNLTTTSTKQTFEDIPVTNWDYKAAEAAKMYLTGYKTSNGKMYFYGSKSSVREDMAVALVKALGLTVVSNDSKLKDTFTDYNSISKNLRSYIYTAYTNNIMEGSNGNFYPQASLTRAEAASLLFKVIQKEEKVAVDDPNDIDKVVVGDTDNEVNDATLCSLKYNGITVDNFQKNTDVYNVVLPASTKNVPSVTAKANDSRAIVSIIQPVGLPGNAKIVVTSENGKTTMTYKIYFQVKANNDAKLKSIKCMGATIYNFDSNTTYYQVKLKNNNVIPIVTATANDSNAKLTITQATDIPGTAEVTVTAEDKVTTITYRVYFYLERS